MLIARRGRARGSSDLAHDTAGTASHHYRAFHQRGSLLSDDPRRWYSRPAAASNTIIGRRDGALINARITVPPTPRRVKRERLGPV